MAGACLCEGCLAPPNGLCCLETTPVGQAVVTAVSPSLRGSRLHVHLVSQKHPEELLYGIVLFE